jgi:hypothetical protein
MSRKGLSISSCFPSPPHAKIPLRGHSNLTCGGQTSDAKHRAASKHYQMQNLSNFSSAKKCRGKLNLDKEAGNALMDSIS